MSKLDKFTRSEIKAIQKLRTALESLPPSLCLYVIDGGEIVICQKGTSSYQCITSIDCNIDAGSMLSEIHEDAEWQGRGE